MTSIFTAPAWVCGSYQPFDEHIFLSPDSESIDSPEFDVLHEHAVVRAFNLAGEAAVRLETVYGEGINKLYGPVLVPEHATRLNASQTLITVPWPGKYRLVAEGVEPGITMPTVVVHWTAFNTRRRLSGNE